MWASADPILGEYLPTGNKEHDSNLLGMGGALNPPNLGLYAYAHNNPMKLVDPDGNAIQLAPVVVGGAIILYRLYKLKQAASKAQYGNYGLQIAQISSTLYYTDREKRPPPDENVFTAIANETLTGQPTKGKYHRDKGAQVANRFIKLKGEIANDRVLSAKQKRKLFGAINVQLKPLKAGIEAFDRSPLTPADAKKVTVRDDKWKIK